MTTLRLNSKVKDYGVIGRGGVKEWFRYLSVEPR